MYFCRHVSCSLCFPILKTVFRWCFLYRGNDLSRFKSIGLIDLHSILNHMYMYKHVIQLVVNSSVTLMYTYCLKLFIRKYYITYIQNEFTSLLERWTWYTQYIKTLLPFLIDSYVVFDTYWFRYTNVLTHLWCPE